LGFVWDDRIGLGSSGREIAGYALFSILLKEGRIVNHIVRGAQLPGLFFPLNLLNTYTYIKDKLSKINFPWPGMGK